MAAGLGAVVDAVRSHGTAVAQAPPGSGKTTLVPPALAVALGGRVLVTQPRRIAARAAARRLAELVGEPVGSTAGYTVRDDRRVGPATRVEVVTTGVLLRRLQRDPELPGVAAVVLDEVHERHLDGDLALALLVDVRAHLRPDLALVAMSATVEAARTAAVLGAAGGPAPVVTVPGALHPVEEVWAPPPPRVVALDERGVTAGFLDHVAATAVLACSGATGDVLVFVPGAAEVDAVVDRVRARAGDGGAAVDVRPLHGRLSVADQDLALRPGPRRRVVVATAVAESSLTVPGVRVVVDGGLERRPRTDHARGLAGLVTVGVSRAGADQRAGRAGREGPGVVHRCWTPGEHARRPAHPEPEIRTADLVGFLLEAACWGAPRAAGLALLDEPPAGAVAAAEAVLHGIGAVDAAGVVTDRGRAVAEVPADSRVARALLDAVGELGPRRAAEVAALLSDEVRAPDGDLVAALRSLRRGGPAAASWRRRAEGLQRAVRARTSSTIGAVIGTGGPPGPGAAATGTPVPGTSVPGTSVPGTSVPGTSVPGTSVPGTSVPGTSVPGTSVPGTSVPGTSVPGTSVPCTRVLGDDAAVALVVALAHPDRIARRREDGNAYLLASGTGAVLPPASALQGSPWLAVAEAVWTPGRRDALVRSAVPTDAATALLAAAPLLVEEDVVAWVGGRVVAHRVQRLGAIELRGERLPRPDPERVRAAVRDGLARSGLGVLRWGEGATALRRRLDLLHRHLGAPWPPVDDAALTADLDRWLGPDLGRVRTGEDLARIDVAAALRRLLPWPEAARLDELAPERVTVPSGSSVRVDYAADPPALPVRLQETFGWRTAPRVVDGRVPLVLHLLSPAGRPAAVTADLESFWRSGYAQVRGELRRRYPRHAWPEDPTTAAPVRGVQRRR
ncbi:ATP-dependent RNA helicase [Cellulomonas marina]|uniref:ATP-dependent RNA helicase n=2 Tax=Cellulomonas marina TaxID=988821 RepID=UPI001FD5BD34|nr:ATP-dependent helicase C-terminal domain-containing protein [Cellulomonas marina]